MLIDRVILKNWKNFQNVDINLENRAFVVGANASGKSNFLDVFRFLRDIAKQSGGLQYAIDQRGGVSKIRCLSARSKSNVSIEIHLSESSGESRKLLWKYKLSFKHGGGGIIKNSGIVTEEKVWSSEQQKWLLDRNDKTEEDSETLKFTHLEQINSNKPFRDIYVFFLNLQYLNIVPQLVRDADSYMLATNKEDFYGRNLLDKMAKTTTVIRNSYLKKINEVLRIAVPQLDHLDFIKDKKSGVPHLEAKYIHWRPQGGKQQEAQFSDGTLRLIGFMWALLDGNETILLEEPELYLHTLIVKQLPEFISKFQKKRNRIRQVILTTHSYDLLSSTGIGGEEVIVLETTPEGTTVKQASDIKQIRDYLKAGFTIADSVLPNVAPKKIENILQLRIYDND